MLESIQDNMYQELVLTHSMMLNHTVKVQDLHQHQLRQKQTGMLPKQLALVILAGLDYRMISMVMMMDIGIGLMEQIYLMDQVMDSMQIEQQHMEQLHGIQVNQMNGEEQMKTVLKCIPVVYIMIIAALTSVDHFVIQV